MTAAAPPTVISDLLAVDPNYEGGWVVIRGRRLPVSRLGFANVAGESPEYIAKDWSLSLAQVHAALAYFYANREEIEATVRAYDAETIRLAKQATGSS
jgi:uncharacterized protein (DUF433 family)